MSPAATPSSLQDALAGQPASSILWKALGILETFGRDRSLLSLSQISRRSALPKSTAHRVVGMLLEMEVLERVGKDYRLGSWIFTLASRSREVVVREAARPYIQAVALKTGQIVQLSVLRDRDVQYLEKLGDARKFSPVSVGDRLGAHMTAAGKAMLSFSDDATVRAVLCSDLERRTPATITDPRLLAAALADVRMNRVATDLGGVREGLNCIAVPVLHDGHAVAAVSIAYPSSAGPSPAFLGPLQEGTARISRSLRTAEMPVRWAN